MTVLSSHCNPSKQSLFRMHIGTDSELFFVRISVINSIFFYPLCISISLREHKGHLTSKLNSKTVSVLPSLNPSLILHLLPSPVIKIHRGRFPNYLCTLTDFPSLTFWSCHRTKAVTPLACALLWYFSVCHIEGNNTQHRELHLSVIPFMPLVGICDTNQEDL